MPTPVAPRSDPAPRILRDTVRRIWTHRENRGRRRLALLKYLAWQVWQRVVRRPRTVRLTGATRIRCHPHSPVASAVVYYGLVDPAEMRFVLNYLRPGDEFIDAGANVGVYTLLACSVPGVRALALEPSTTAFARAAENLALNGFSHRVTLVQQAVGDRPGPARLTVGRDAMNALVPADAGEPTEPVIVGTLDHLAAEHNLEAVALVKVDVEGWEVEALQGAAGLLKNRRPALIVEANDPEGIERLRRKFGYQRVEYRPATNTVVPSAGTPERGANVILVADPDRANDHLRSKARQHSGISPPAH